jgi:hypothetical protein
MGWVVLFLGLVPAALWDAIATQPLFEKPHTPRPEEGRIYSYLIGKGAGIVYLTTEEYDRAHHERIYSALLAISGLAGGVLVSLAQRASRKAADRSTKI